MSEQFPLGHMGDPFGESDETDESTTKTRTFMLNEDSLGELIAGMGPNVSWVDGVPSPSPAEIRDQVGNFTEFGDST